MRVIGLVVIGLLALAGCGKPVHTKVFYKPDPTIKGCQTTIIFRRGCDVDHKTYIFRGTCNLRYW